MVCKVSCVRTLCVALLVLMCMTSGFASVVVHPATHNRKLLNKEQGPKEETVGDVIKLFKGARPAGYHNSNEFIRANPTLSVKYGNQGQAVKVVAQGGDFKRPDP